jgi:alpha-tubulin suppressor-like RCC1 family protein
MLVKSLEAIQVKQVDCGLHYACMVTEGGDLYSWGDNSCQ